MTDFVRLMKTMTADNRIGSHSGHSTDLRVRTAEHSFRRHVASGGPIKYQNRIRSDGKEDLVIDAIDGNRIERAITGADDLRMRSLNVADGRFFSVRASAKNEDRLSQRTIDDNFVVNRIVVESVHGPADQRLLTDQRSGRRRVLLCQPGKGRNLRMGHSVGHQIFFSLGIVGHRLDLA